MKKIPEKSASARCYLRRLVSLLACAVMFLVVSPFALRGQDDPPHDPVPANPAPSGISLSSAQWRDVSANLLLTNFLRDQETMWSFPFQLARGQHWSPTITVLAATVTLLSADPHVQPYFNHTRAFRGFDRVFSSRVTGVGTIAVPVALYAVGFERHDSYMQKTALFAGEAVADSEMARIFVNSVTKRWRPQDVFTRRTYSDTFFHSRSYVGSSFPSGHTIAAVAVATVIARRYREHRWVPWVAYCLAGTIAFSRISLRAHFPSDVFLGTVLGYAIARYDVLQDY